MSHSLEGRVTYSKECGDGKSSAGEARLSPEDSLPQRPCSYQNWCGSVSMQRACDAVKSKEHSLREASELYGIPKSTLYDHVSGKVKPGGTSGPERYLNVQEEEELVNFLVGCSQIGYPRTRPQNGWWQKFRSRHKNISLRTAAPLSQARAMAMAMDRTSIDKYFNILENTLKDNCILDKAKHIFNVDESGFPLSPKPLKTIAEKGSKNPSIVGGPTKAQITVLSCVNAAGDCIPPFVVFAGKRLNPQYAIGEVPNTYYGLSPKGWMDTGLFEDWFKDQFLTFAPPICPLLLMMDGHSSHFSPEMIRIAADEGVILFVLPPNTTNLTQPLDKGVFSALKMNWRHVCHEFVTQNPGRVVSRYDFSSLFHQAWDNSMSIGNIKSGFRITGICPFNKRAITLPGEDHFSSFDPDLLGKQTGIKYIPLYSSSPIHSTASRCNDRCSGDDDSSDDSPARRLDYHSPVFSTMLVLPEAPSRLRTKYPKSSGRTLTLDEQLENGKKRRETKGPKPKAQKKDEKGVLRVDGNRYSVHV